MRWVCPLQHRNQNSCLVQTESKIGRLTHLGLEIQCGRAGGARYQRSRGPQQTTSCRAGYLPPTLPPRRLPLCVRARNEQQSSHGSTLRITQKFRETIEKREEACCVPHYPSKHATQVQCVRLVHLSANGTLPMPSARLPATEREAAGHLGMASQLAMLGEADAQQ